MRTYVRADPPERDAVAGPPERDAVAEMLKPDSRSTCFSPLPLLHWLYLQYVVGEQYVRQDVSLQPRRAQATCPAERP